MKRRAMIEEIARVISDFDGKLEPTRNDMFVASAVLTKIEELGMQPPVMQGVYDNVPTVTPTGNHEYSYKRGWEKE